jgi:hypothetical protein
MSSLQEQQPTAAHNGSICVCMRRESTCVPAYVHACLDMVGGKVMYSLPVGLKHAAKLKQTLHIHKQAARQCQCCRNKLFVRLLNRSVCSARLLTQGS